jgi:arabinogalactan endo-1,4-beta-galactosidase
LKENGAKWDVIGMSLYPDDSDWETETDNCLSNIKTLESRYGCKVVLSEVGMPWDSENAEAFMTKLVTGCKAIDGCLGVFYWEPECYNGWQGYSKGVFDNSGRPTSTLDVFK